MYLFPFALNKESGATKEEENFFLPYALQRIAVLKPQIIIYFGRGMIKYGSAGLRIRNGQPFGNKGTRLPEKNAISYNFGIHEVLFVPCPHPFAAMKEREYSQAVNSLNWEECFCTLHNYLQSKKRIEGNVFGLMKENMKKQVSSTKVESKRKEIQLEGGQITLDSLLQKKQKKD